MLVLILQTEISAAQAVLASVIYLCHSYLINFLQTNFQGKEIISKFY